MFAVSEIQRNSFIDYRYLINYFTVITNYFNLKGRLLSYPPLEAVKINRFDALKRLQCNPNLILHISVICKITAKSLYVHFMIFRTYISVIRLGSPLKGLK